MSLATDGIRIGNAPLIVCRIAGSERRPKVEVVRDAAAAIAGLFGGEGRTATAAAQYGIDANVGVTSGTGISVGFRRAPPMRNLPRGVF